ncbi:MAG: electron transfer flavoprotein subunit alpha/FixB family protein [Oligoflexia bacterium]|nr:electron transfer flavoprotein subunit alpha/FixB family protein [Oligoflexia bacterium]
MNNNFTTDDNQLNNNIYVFLNENIDNWKILIREAVVLAQNIGHKVSIIINNDKKETSFQYLNLSLPKSFWNEILNVFYIDVTSSANDTNNVSNFLNEFFTENLAYAIFFSNNSTARELAAGLAYHLNTAVICNCIGFRNVREKTYYRRQLPLLKIEDEISVKSNIPAIVLWDLTLWEDTYGEIHFKDDIEVSLNNLQQKIINLSIAEIDMTNCFNQQKIKYFDEEIIDDLQKVDIRKSEKIIGVGLGVIENANLLEDVLKISEILKWKIGYTRPAAEYLNLSHQDMIGRTGRFISPAIYLTLGISGSSHHTAGILKSKEIVAVNNDHDAQIFLSSDLGLIADLKELLPSLRKKICEWNTSKTNGIK